MENENNNPIPYHDPTGDDHLSAEQILNFGNENVPSLGPSTSSNFSIGSSNYTNYYNNNATNAGLLSQPPATDAGGGASTSYIAGGGNEGVPGLGFNEFPEIPGPSTSSNIIIDPRNYYGNGNAVLFPQQVATDPAGASTSYSGGGGGSFFGPSDPTSELWDFVNDSSGNEDGYFDFAGASSGYVGGGVGYGGTGGGNGNNNEILQSADFGNPVQLPVWPAPPTPYNCSCCQVLREIFHTKGEQIATLELHGRIGIISHAILDKHDYYCSTGNRDYQMFDFSRESIVTVQNFLLQYCELRKFEGYAMVPDPLSIFYKTLCIGIDDDMENQNNNNNNTAISQSTAPMDNSGNDTMAPEQQEDTGNQPNAGDDRGKSARPPSPERGQGSRQGGGGGGGRGKTSLAAQRERTGKMKLQDFAECFDIPINLAAAKMNVCTTVIKKKCREVGLERWPYRKIQGLKKKIKERKQKSLSPYITDEERARLLSEIQMLEQELSVQYQQHRPNPR